MRVLGCSLIALALLGVNTLADQIAYPAKTEAATKPPATTPAEEKAITTQQGKVAKPAGGAAAVKVPPKTSSGKPPAPAASAEVQRLIRSGQIDAGRAVAEGYKTSEAPAAQRADVSLTYGNELVRATRYGKGKDPALYSEAKQQFQSVIKEGMPEQQLVARNNLAALALEAGDYVAALQVLDEGYATAQSVAEPLVRSQYFFNYAQALERAPGAQNRNPADLYREAFVADPRRREAADAGMKSALSQGNVARAADFVELLVERGHLELADKRVREALGDAKVRQSADAYQLVAALMSLIAAQRLSLPAFNERWLGYVIGLSEGLDERAGTMRKLALLGYTPPEKHPQVPETFPAEQASLRMKEMLGIRGWPQHQVAHASAYLTRVGNVRAANDELSAALSLYSIAWLADNQNVNAAADKANLLLEHPREIAGAEERLNRFIDQLFWGKGEAYLGNDWPGIMRFHSVLGTIYYKRRQWGGTYDPRGAVFQLEHAVNARKQISGKEGSDPVPGLYTMLADCYVATNRLPQAYDAYQTAAREALDAQNTQLAADIVQDKLPRIAGYAPTPKQRDIAVILEKDIRAQREGA